MNTKDFYTTPFVKLMNFLKYKPLRLLSLLVIVPVGFIIASIWLIACEFPDFVRDTKDAINDVIHWDELKDTREIGLPNTKE